MLTFCEAHQEGGLAMAARRQYASVKHRREWFSVALTLLGVFAMAEAQTSEFFCAAAAHKPSPGFGLHCFRVSQRAWHVIQDFSPAPAPAIPSQAHLRTHTPPQPPPAPFLGTVSATTFLLRLHATHATHA